MVGLIYERKEGPDMPEIEELTTREIVELIYANHRRIDRDSKRTDKLIEICLGMLQVLNGHGDQITRFQRDPSIQEG